MTAHPITGIPGLFLSPLHVLARVPEAATQFVVGADPTDATRCDEVELEGRYREWMERWRPVALSRRQGETDRDS